jgi:hypothetical protein
LLLLDLVHAFKTIGSQNDPITELMEVVPENISYGMVIIDDHDSRFIFHESLRLGESGMVSFHAGLVFSKT